MKRVLLMFFSVFSLFPQVGCASNYPLAKVTVQVVNQDGNPVTDTRIHAGFYNGERDLAKWPDKNGMVSFCSSAFGTSALMNERSDSPRDDKYYTTILRRFYWRPSENTKDGKWQPWNPTITMVLRERKNPIPMYATPAQYDITTPQENAWLGFDMQVCDWVSPNGKGKHADVELFLERTESPADEKQTRPRLKLRFPDPLAGCYWVDYSENHSVTSLRSPYQAEISQDYSMKELVLPENFHSNGGTMRYVKNLFDDRALIFRTRTRVDTEGRLLGAYYGKIQAPVLYVTRIGRDGKVTVRLHYYFNPTENDLNIEFDPGRNLLDKKVRGEPVNP